jgi:CheY-like chemotaxis protein
MPPDLHATRSTDGHTPATDATFAGGRRVAAGDELRILLIEDSRLLRDRMIGMLTVPGVMRVAGAAETEREAIALIDANDYDALVVDVELKQGSGITAIRHARLSFATQRQPLIIVLTNYALPTVRQRCIEAGADHFLDKMQQFSQVRPLLEAARRHLDN